MFDKEVPLAFHLSQKATPRYMADQPYILRLALDKVIWCQVRKWMWVIPTTIMVKENDTTFWYSNLQRISHTYTTQNVFTNVFLFIHDKFSKVFQKCVVNVIYLKQSTQLGLCKFEVTYKFMISGSILHRNPFPTYPRPHSISKDIFKGHIQQN